jgi:hypothetical protein
MKESRIMGRIAVYVPDHPAANSSGYVLRSRYVVEQALGRYLIKDEEVHHIDRNKLNDELGNLQVLTKREHAELHGSEKRILDYDLLSQLMSRGYGYKKIAKETGYKIPSVQSAARRIKRGTWG